MPRTPNSFPGQREDESLLILSGTLTPAKNGEIIYVQSEGFKFYEEGAVKTLPSSSISAEGHKTLRQLVHLAEEGGPWEGFPNVIRDIGPAGNPFPTASVWWTDSTRQQKIVEKIIVRNTNRTPTTIQWKVYVSGSNTVASSFTDTITYNGVIETSRTRTSS